MKFPIDGKTLLALVFIAVSAVSAVNLAQTARGYQLLYVSMQQLQFSVSKMSFQQSQQSILVEMTCDNPIDYGGLTVISISMSAFLYYSGGTLFQGNPLQETLAISQPITPHGQTSWTTKLLLNPQNTTSIAQYEQSYGSLTANVTLQTLVSSFLYHVTGSGGGYETQQNVTLTGA